MLTNKHAEEDRLRDAVTQLDELNPEEGEEDTLAAERVMLANVNRIAESLLSNRRSAQKQLIPAGDSGQNRRCSETAGGLLDPVAAAEPCRSRDCGSQQQHQWRPGQAGG